MAEPELTQIFQVRQLDMVVAELVEMDHLEPLHMVERSHITQAALRQVPQEMEPQILVEVAQEVPPVMVALVVRVLL
jgi:hypothetical protein